MQHEFFNFIDHRPDPPHKTKPDTKKAIANTNPTQLKPFKFNRFKSNVLSVLGVLGLTVLA
jgi:hypothetical protein